ncbi:hypothetical protein [Bacillus cereus]|uniref:hypothetical protein n=1 Tax=Bacillus cereus TaxID=1396 RepID=UPI000BFB8C95|nr:hypothetical protein [Bacillus cereus]PGV23030.1 hypothetical protein COD93_29635 [Bacillus cereus]
MSRKRLNPTHSLGQFIYGIYDYHHDRGMPQKTAKARMIDNTLEACVSVVRKEEEIPDQMIVLMAQWMSRTLNDRGVHITRGVTNKQTEDKEAFKALTDLKNLKNSLDTFIENYKGWSDTNGKEDR